MRVIQTILLALFAMLVPATAWSQNIPDSKGTDFWFALMPNFHNSYDVLDNNEVLRLQHEVYIFISAETPTSGRITLRDEFGQERVEVFTITDPAVVYEFRTFVKPYELRGWNRSGTIDYIGMQTEKVSEQSIHIQSGNEITVYVANQAVLTSEAFLVLPTDALAEDYVVASYTSDIVWISPLTREPTNQSTPSQFCVVATEDGTEVVISPSAATFLSPNLETQRVQLNRGQVYMLQVDPRVNRYADLTGSVVRANKPVAVFGGHMRATLPIEDKATLGSRDCLIEQMNPVRTWGRSAFIFPFAVSSTEVTTSNSRYRVISAFDSTDVYVNDELVATLDANTFYEGELTEAAEVRTSQPVMVAMLKKTAGPGSTQAVRVGDPFMMLVPPAEQFMNAYRFVSMQAYEYSISGGIPTKVAKVYIEQYLNVVIRQTGIASLQLDGTLVDASLFQPLSNTGYYWAQISVADGIHSISSDENFGIYVYGYGVANSYGYIGGMAFRPLDIRPPSISGNEKCGQFLGTITDSVIGDTRIRFARILPGSEVNVSAGLVPFTPPSPMVQFTASLIDPYADGSFAVEATDDARQVASEVFMLPGYTIAVTSRLSNPEPVDVVTLSAIQKYTCDTLVIENYGTYPRSIANIYTALGSVIQEPIPPLTLQPGDSALLVICSVFDVPGVYNDTVYIGDDCSPRPIANLVHDVRADEEAPYGRRTNEPCSTEYIVDVSDDRMFDYGILLSSIREDLLVNCTVQLQTTTVPVHQYSVNVLDPLYDAIYAFEAVDSAGNRSVIVDTIAGFTLSVDGASGYYSEKLLEPATVGSTVCDTVWLGNYGLFPQTIRSVFIRGNTVFSTPQHQFPIVIQPGSRSPMLVCYEAVIAGLDPDIDTVDFGDECLIKQLRLWNTATPVQYAGISRCNLPITATVTSARSGLIVAPMPASDVLLFRLDSPVENMQIRIIDMQGSVVHSATWHGTPAQDFSCDVANVPAGTYVLSVQHTGDIHTTLIVLQ